MVNKMDFNERCYRLLENIPQGKVTTYKEMARALGTKAWRAVGTAMAKNTKLITIPCHRVIRSDGRIGQYALGVERKAELLKKEGVLVKDDKVIDIDKHFYKFEV